METITRGSLQAELDAFKISEELGFVLKEPLTNLPEYYRIWMYLANNVTQLIESHKLRDLVDKMPVLSVHLLTTHKELRLAHLALGFICSGYVWQEGTHAPARTLPKALALPFWLVSRSLGLPAILTFADAILANWKLRDPSGDLDVNNIDMIFSFPGGDASKGFLLVSLLVEIAATSGVKGAVMVMHALKTADLIEIKRGLLEVTHSLKKMREVFQLMHNHVEVQNFFGKMRIFLFGWRENPMIPNGLLYEGVSDEPIALSGSSAAQSTAIQCFDALLCIQHEEATGAFLANMREYMPPAHSQLIETLSALPSLRDFVFSCPCPELCQIYNASVSALVELRNYHLNIVTKYIVVPNNRSIGCPLGGAASEKTGSAGTNPLIFLKSVRDTTKKALILNK